MEQTVMSRGLSREPFVDAFFTLPVVIDDCVNQLRPFLPSNCMYVDFSAGQNAFAIKLGLPYLAFDLYKYPNTQGTVEQRDWLSVDHLDLMDGCTSMCVGFNPPFGHHFDLVHRFVEHAMSFQPSVIALLCPANYKPKVHTDRLYETVLRHFVRRDAFYIPTTNTPFAFPCKFLVLKKRITELVPTSKPGLSGIPCRISMVYSRNDVPRHERAILIRIIGAKAGRSFFDTHANGSLTEYRLNEATRTVSSWDDTGIADRRYDVIELLDDNIDRARFREGLLDAWREERPDAFWSEGGYNYSISMALLRSLIVKVLERLNVSHVQTR
jgi:hypothetical protein